MDEPCTRPSLGCAWLFEIILIPHYFFFLWWQILPFFWTIRRLFSGETHRFIPLGACCDQYFISASKVVLAVKDPPANERDVKRRGFNPGVRKIPWRRKWQPAPVFLPGKFHGQRGLADYSPWGCKKSDTTEWLSIHCLFIMGCQENCICFLKGN